MSRTRGQRAHRKAQKSMEKYHEKMVSRIYENPQELDENAPHPAMIVLKLKEPELPGLLAKKKKGSLVDLLFFLSISRLL